MELTRVRVLAFGAFLTLIVAIAMVVLRAQHSADLVLKIEPVDANETVAVYVGGAVQRPGLYTLAKGARVADAVTQAGALPEADLTALPMADRIRDGQSLQVKPKAGTPVSAPDGSLPPDNSATGGLVDINHASVTELESLPGIGPALAQRIIDYRQQHGPFGSVEDLVAVRGISARMVQDLTGLVAAAE